MVTRNKDMDIGVIHKSKEGFQIQVIEYKSWSNVVVKFLDFDVEVRSNSSDIRLGKVEKPRGKRKETNISYGNFDSLGVDTLDNAGIPTCIASVWRSMICRCYNKNHYNYKYYGMLGVTVCTEWHSYENFHSWYVKNYPKDGGSYCLDKDLLSTGSKEYSPEKCTFITREENSKLAGISKGENYKYRFISPSGDIFEFSNLARFSRSNGLLQSKMSDVNLGIRRHHKGWVKAQ